MNFTELVDELDRPDIHVNDFIRLLEYADQTLSLVQRKLGDDNELTRRIAKSRDQLIAALDRVE
jgi:hypothetical protein